MLYLSLDVGIVNLGACIYHSTEGIKDWKVITLNKNNVVRSIIKELDAFIGDATLNKVVIEKQPSRNVKMRTIEGMIEMYFGMKQIEAVKYSAKYKLKSQNMNIKGKHNYRERKRLSIQVVSKIVKNTSYEEFFKKEKKKDDLADSLLQIMSYCNVEIPTITEESREVETKIVSRKPSKNQERKGYSINNIKYFFKTFDIEECRKNVKLDKAVINYFKTWENAKKFLL